MSGFTDMMIDDGFTDPEEYMEYLEDKYFDGYECNSFQDSGDYWEETGFEEPWDDEEPEADTDDMDGNDKRP